MAGYFQNFPKTYYSINADTNYQVFTNIFLRFKIRDEVKSNASMYFKYIIRDGDTPEGIATKIYGTPHAFWIIYHMNDWISLYKNFPMNENELQNFVSKKYSNPNAIHHYEDSNKNWVSSNYPLKTNITNLEYERQLNEEKRIIKILDPQYYSEIQREFENEMLKVVS